MPPRHSDVPRGLAFINKQHSSAALNQILLDELSKDHPNQSGVMKWKLPSSNEQSFFWPSSIEDFSWQTEMKAFISYSACVLKLADGRSMECGTCTVSTCQPCWTHDTTIPQLMLNRHS